ncbi:MAG: YkvS family protein [Lysinibacillus sp.]
MKIAEVGNIVEFKEGLQGLVEKVNENSVIVNLTIMDDFNNLEMEEKTVVNHKRYKILQS